jgi:chromosome segregation ATPase
MKRGKLNFIIALLVGITLFSLFKYIKMYYERKTILNDLIAKESQILMLNTLKEHLSNQLKEKTNLIAEKEKLQQELMKELAIKDEKLVKVEELLNKAQMDIEQLQQKINRLESQNASLVQEKQLLLENLDKLNQEHSALLSRWQSIEELRKAIIQLKRKIYSQRRQTSKTEDRAIQGNRGYIIKDGLPTLKPKVKIEVVPVQ